MIERSTQDAAQLAQESARQHYGRLLAILSARSGDIARAEDALASAFEAALRRWPLDGVPATPQAWLLTVARNALIDDIRSQQKQGTMAAELAILADELQEEKDSSAIPDHRLALLFACAHPAIDASVRAPLMLQTILGLDAASIAAAFLQSPSAMAQKLVRAKAKIRDARIRFVLPDQDDIPARLDAVLQAIYSAYASGWAEFDDLQRRDIATEAIWLGQLLCHLAPQEAEAFGLLALMLYTEARRDARRDAHGDYVPLDQQDTKLWDHASIARAETLLAHAATLQSVGRFQLEAAIQSAHAIRRWQKPVDTAAISQLYAQLLQLSDSPVIRLHHAVALAASSGPEPAWAQLQSVAQDKRMENYQPYWAASAHLLSLLGKHSEAEHAYVMAIGLTSDAAVRRFLQKQRLALLDAEQW